MNTSRITPPIVALIGAVLCLLTLGGIAFFLIKPVQDETTVQQARLDANAPGATPGERADGLAAEKLKDQKQVADAIVQVKAIQLRWAQMSARLMPPFNVGGKTPADRSRALRQITAELVHNLGPDLERQMTTTGVTSTTKFALPAPPINPNAITAAPIIIPLGVVNVNGDFRRILTHVYDWQDFNRLVLVNNLALHGNSPYMQGTYDATVYIFPQGDDNLAPPVPGAPPAGAATAAGG